MHYQRRSSPQTGMCALSALKCKFATTPQKVARQASLNFLRSTFPVRHWVGDMLDLNCVCACVLPPLPNDVPSVFLR